MGLIDADELRDYFFSETSGTDEIIQCLIDKHNLTYDNDVNEDDVISLCYELLEMVQNVIDTEPTAYDVNKVVEQLEAEKAIAFLTLANTGRKDIDFAYDKVLDYLNVAIEIVKAGDKE